MDMYQKRKMRQEKKKNNVEESTETVSLNWYPGHMKKTKEEIRKKIKNIDLVLEVIDSRFPFLSRLSDLNDYVLDKPKIIIATKYDLCDKDKTNKYLDTMRKNNYVVTTYLNDSNLKSEIIKLSKTIIKNSSENKFIRPIRCLVVGIPNVGKSNIINTLSNKKLAKVENKAGVTRHLNYLEVDPYFYVLDTPGILMKKFNNYEEEMIFSLCKALPDKLIDYKEVSIFLYNFLKENYPQKLKEVYKLKEFNDLESDLTLLGELRGKLNKNGVDYFKVYQMIFNDFNNNKFKDITF